MKLSILLVVLCIIVTIIHGYPFADPYGFPPSGNDMYRPQPVPVNYGRQFGSRAQYYQQQQQQQQQRQQDNEEEGDDENEGEEEDYNRGGYQFRQTDPAAAAPAASPAATPAATPASTTVATPPSGSTVTSTTGIGSMVSGPISTPTTVAPTMCAKPGECVDAEMHISLRPSNNPIAAKMESDLEDIRQGIVLHTRGITNEENWINSVQEIMKLYSNKVEKVQEHIAAEHKVIKELMKKRHDIRSKQKSMKLEAELKAANQDMNTLQAELGQVKEKEVEFDKNRAVLKEKITELSTNIAKLKGEENKPKAEEKKVEEKKVEEKKK